MNSHPKSPLISCSPFALLALILLAALWIGWRLAQPLLRPDHDPQAESRLVAARGDLAADEKSTIELFKNASPSIVNIMTSRVARDRFQLRALEVPQGAGTGFVWDENGYVVTNLHVLLQAERTLVTLDDGSRYEARIVGYEADFDIAVLKIDAPREKLRAVPVGASADLQVGQKVFAIGNPFGLDHTLSTGVISGLNREIVSPSQRIIRGVVQTDAAINPGNSGGPLLDSAGRLIGMNTAIASPTNASAGIGFAVPVDTINRVVPSLIRKGKFSRPVLGIIAAPEQVAAAMGVRGVVIGSIQLGSGAEKAGLRALEYDERGRPVADVITSIVGKPVASVDEIWELMGEHKPGDVVRVQYLRDGQRLESDVVLQESR
ncbi:MAG: trypsin-like peptidase domain-containing protein [Planctomycetes bacterium]|nr:trypsin-like peptidase domain-containing protein [Planctomycetota bacterium]